MRDLVYPVALRADVEDIDFLVVARVALTGGYMTNPAERHRYDRPQSASSARSTPVEPSVESTPHGRAHPVVSASQ